MFDISYFHSEHISSLPIHHFEDRVQDTTGVCEVFESQVRCLVFIYTTPAFFQDSRELASLQCINIVV